MQKQDCTQNQQNYWQPSEKIEITKALTVIIGNAKTYGKEYSINDTFAYYQFKLEKRFTAAQVLYAIEKYTDLKNDVPAAADIIAILEPAPPRITQAEFIAAQKGQERNGYPQFSSDAYLIRDYQTQQTEQRSAFKIENDKIKALVNNSVKKIDSKFKETAIVTSYDDVITLARLMPETAFLSAIDKHDSNFKEIAKHFGLPIGAVILRGGHLGIKESIK